MSEDNHNQIYEKLGKLETGINFLVDDAKKKNGYITDLNIRQGNTEKTIIEFRNANEKVYSLLVEQKKEKDNRYQVWAYVKENYVLFLLTITTSGIVGTFIPLFWMWIKKQIFG